MHDEQPIDGVSDGSTAEAEERREAAIEEITSVSCFKVTKIISLLFQVLGIDPAAHNPDHQMGLLGAISFVCGSIIGSGIFISPSTIIKETQSVSFMV